MEGVVYLCVLASIVATWVMTRKWIRKAPEIGLMGWDMNKPGRPKVAEMGGVCVVFGFVLGILIFIGLRTFYLKQPNYVGILAALCTVLMMTIIGMADDLLGWKAGLKQWQKPLLTLFAAMPMMVVNAGQTSMELPILGNVEWGILYPLLIVPIGIVGASNAFNLIAGYNGLEAGMGIIILSTLGYVGMVTNRYSASILALAMTAALLAFLYYNWYPAKVFPGDTMTYSVGSLIACIAILGDMEKIALLLFIPYILDCILVSRSGFKAEAFARVRKDGCLEMANDRIYHLVHLALTALRRFKGCIHETDVVIFIYCIEIVVVVIVLQNVLY